MRAGNVEVGYFQYVKVKTILLSMIFKYFPDNV